MIAESIAEGRWGAVLTARAKLGHNLRRYYRRTKFEAPKGKTMYPKTGWRVRPQYLYVPKAAATSEADAEE